MKNLIKKTFFLVILLSLVYIGCVDQLTSSDTLPPYIILNTPVTGDTLTVAVADTFSYSASDDQGLASIQLYVNDVLKKSFAVENDVLPTVFFTPDSTYLNQSVTIYLKAVDVAGNTNSSKKAENVFISENKNPPAKPSDLSITINSTTSIKLSWTDNSVNESGFEIYRRTSTGSYSKLATVSANVESYEDNTLESSKIYYYKVRAYNKYGNSEFTSEVNSLGIGELNAPSNLTGEALSTKKIKLTWKDNSTEETNFVIQRKYSGDLTFTTKATVSADVTEYTDASLYSGTSYVYRVAALKDTAYSDWSNEVEVTTLTEDYSAPTNLAATYSTSPLKVVLTWTDTNLNELYTRIFRKLSSDANYVQIDSVGPGVITYTDYNVASSNTYIYKVQVRTSAGYISDFSNTAQITVPVVAPTAPSGLSLYDLGSGVYTLEWTDNSDDETAFELWRKDGTADYALIQTLAANVYRTNDAVQDLSITYLYKVRALKGSVASDFSNVVSSTGGTSTYPRPTGLTATVVNADTVVLSWTNNATGALGIIIQRKLTEWGTYAELARVLPNKTQYIDNSSFTVGASYYYRIKVYSLTEESDWSTEAVATIPYGK